MVPTFNSARWLPGTLSAIDESIRRTSLNAEIHVVDDGSTDDTPRVLEELQENTPTPISVTRVPNAGVFAARHVGAQKANSDLLVFVDSRVTCALDAFGHLESTLLSTATDPTMVGHVITDEAAALVGRFWEVPTHVFWGSYLRNPQVTEITTDNFDSVPKGTGFLVIDRNILLSAYKAVGETHGRFVSDDTRLLREVAADRPIILDPEFRATYLPRTTVSEFLKHALLRGTLFVDSYYGTSAIRALTLWGIGLSVPMFLVALLVAAVTGNWTAPAVLAAAGLSLVLVLVGVAIRNRAPRRAVHSFLTYFVPFAVMFWAGIVRGLYLRVTGKTREQ